MVADAIRLDRTDAAMVRVIAPIEGDGERPAAVDAATDFVTALFPRLERYLPR
jgi:hypothetical protein